MNRIGKLAAVSNILGSLTTYVVMFLVQAQRNRVTDNLTSTIYTYG